MHGQPYVIFKTDGRLGIINAPTLLSRAIYDKDAGRGAGATGLLKFHGTFSFCGQA